MNTLAETAKKVSYSAPDLVIKRVSGMEIRFLVTNLQKRIRSSILP
jgi:hypothetical protein